MRDVLLPFSENTTSCKEEALHLFATPHPSCKLLPRHLELVKLEGFPLEWQCHVFIDSLMSHAHNKMTKVVFLKFVMVKVKYWVSSHHEKVD